MRSLLALVCRLVQACRWLYEEWPRKDRPLLIEQKRAAFKAEPKKVIVFRNLLVRRDSRALNYRDNAAI